MTGPRGVEEWETLPEGNHYLKWTPEGYEPQEYVCIDTMLFNIDTANASGYCDKCKDESR